MKKIGKVVFYIGWAAALIFLIRLVLFAFNIRLNVYLMAGIAAFAFICIIAGSVMKSLNQKSH